MCRLAAGGGEARRPRRTGARACLRPPQGRGKSTGQSSHSTQAASAQEPHTAAAHRHDPRATSIHSDAALCACPRGCGADAERPGAERSKPGGSSIRYVPRARSCAEGLATRALPLTFRRVLPLLQSLYTSFPNLVDIDGMPISLAQFKGNVSLVINVATY